MKRFVLSIAAFVGLVTGCQAASPSFSSFYTNHFTTNGLVIKANLNPTQFDTNSSSITITITNVSGISGGSHWTNPIGVLQPRSGQTTNALLFISASSDNATNSAFTVDTVNTWTDIDARLIQGRIQGTNLFGVSPFGTVSVGRGVGGIWYAPDESDVFAGVRDASLGESEYAAFHFAAIDHQDATNYATFTKTLRSGANASGVSTFRAAIDGLISEVAMHVQPSAGVARLEVENMGDTTFSVFDNAGTFAHNMLWAVDGFAMVPSLTTNLVVGVNELETMNEGVILLTGPTTNPADTIVNLGDGNGVGNFFVLINNAQNSAFTLQDGDPLWDNPLAFQRLNGNWVSTNRGDSIWLFNNGWFITEIGRISGNTNVSAPVVMNPTDLYLPYRQAEGVFADSPFYLTATGSTNVNAKGTIYSGLNSFSLYGDSDLAFVQYRSVNNGDADTGGFAVYTQMTNAQAIATLDAFVQTNRSFLALGWNDGPSAGRGINLTTTSTDSQFDISDLNGVTRVLFQSSETSSTSGSVAHFVDTDTTWTQGTVFGIKNNSTNMLGVGHTGQLYFGPYVSGSPTNVLYRDGSDLVFTNGYTQPAFYILNGSGTGAKVSGSSGGGRAMLEASGLAGAGLGVVGNNDGVIFQGSVFAPLRDNTTDVSGPSSSAWFKNAGWRGTNYVAGYVSAGTNYSWLAITHTGTNGTVNLDSQSANSAGDPRSINFQIGSTNIARIDRAASAGETRFWLYDEDNGTMERVTVGAADSGGSGYKLLRIPN